MASTGYDRIRKKNADGVSLPLSELEQNMDKALHEVLTQKGNASFVNASVAARMHALSAAEIAMDGTKAIVLFVPYKLLSVFKMAHRPLIENLEKKFS